MWTRIFRTRKDQHWNRHTNALWAFCWWCCWCCDAGDAAGCCGVAAGGGGCTIIILLVGHWSHELLAVQNVTFFRWKFIQRTTFPVWQINQLELKTTKSALYSLIWAAFRGPLPAVGECVLLSNCLLLLDGVLFLLLLVVTCSWRFPLLSKLKLVLQWQLQMSLWRWFKSFFFSAKAFTAPWAVQVHSNSNQSVNWNSGKVKFKQNNNYKSCGRKRERERDNHLGDTKYNIADRQRGITNSDTTFVVKGLAIV